MENLNLLLEWLGITLDSSATSSPLFLISFCVLIFSMIALFCFINIIIYFIVLLLVQNKTLLEKISQYKILIKLINFYKGLSMFSLIVEIIIFIGCFGGIILFSGKVVLQFIK